MSVYNFFQVQAQIEIVFPATQMSPRRVVPKGALGWLKDVEDKKTAGRYVEWDNGVIGYCHKDDIDATGRYLAVETPGTDSGVRPSLLSPGGGSYDEFPYHSEAPDAS